MYDDVDPYPQYIYIQTEKATQLTPLLESLIGQELALPRMWREWTQIYLLIDYCLLLTQRY